MKIVKFVIVILAVALIAVGLSRLVLVEPLSIAGEDYVYTSRVASYDPTIDGIDLLDIRAQNRSIVVKESDSIEVISISFSTSTVNTLTFEVVDNKLIVTENELSWWQQMIAFWNMSEADRVIEITVPDDYVADTYQLNTLNGSVELRSGIEARAMGVQSANGDIEVSSLAVDHLLLTTMNGSIAVDQTTITNEAELHTMNGFVFLGHVTADSLDLETSNGAIELEVVTVDTLLASSLNGDIRIEDLEAMESDVSTANGSIDIDYLEFLSASMVDSIHAVTANGSVYFNNVNQNTSNYTLNGTGSYIIECHTSNGTIRIS